MDSFDAFVGDFCSRFMPSLPGETGDVFDVLREVTVGDIKGKLTNRPVNIELTMSDTETILGVIGGYTGMSIGEMEDRERVRSIAADVIASRDLAVSQSSPSVSVSSAFENWTALMSAIVTIKLFLGKQLEVDNLAPVEAKLYNALIVAAASAMVGPGAGDE